VTDATRTGTSLPPPGDEDAFYVIDLSGYIFRAYHALPAALEQQGRADARVYGTRR